MICEQKFTLFAQVFFFSVPPYFAYFCHHVSCRFCIKIPFWNKFYLKKQAFLILLDKIRQKKLFQLMIWVWGKKFVKLLLKNWNLALLSDCLLLSLNYRGRYRQPRSKQKQSFKFLNFIIFTALICFFNHFRSSDRRFNVPTSTLIPSNID